MSEVLTADSPTTIKKFAELFGASWWKIWTGLSDALRTGEPQSKAQLGMEFWDYCQANPKEMEDFGEAMRSQSDAAIRGVLEHCDFSNVQSVVDVGGGFGHLVIGLLKRYPHLRASVVDLPDLTPVSQRQAKGEDPDVLARLSFVGMDMFEDVPAADAYILKHIIHDWNDAKCLRVLRNCCKRMEGDGRVFCIDAVLPPMGDTDASPAKLLDINMIVMVDGKERTEDQWRSLFAEAGLDVASITSLMGFGTGASIIEGTKR